MSVKKESRFNFFNEILEILDQVEEVAQRYRVSGYSVNLLFLGDIIDRSQRDPDSAMLIQSVLRYFCAKFDSVNSVCGNHGITYASANPVWHLVKEVKSHALLASFSGIQPKSIEPIITVPETLEDGNVTFYFNHYNIPALVPECGDTKINIGLFHQPVGSNDICKMWGTFTDVSEAAFVAQYDYCFFGHMHMAFGKYWLNEQHTSQGEWLGSLGRCTVPEVLETPLTRNIPAVLIDGGAFQKVEDNEIVLPAGPAIIDFAQYNASKKTREALKQRENLVTHNDMTISMYECIERSCAANGLTDIFEMCARGSDVAVVNYHSYCQGTTLC